ncbi:MAG: inorganic phosphate transporter [Candidatus Cloacimonetes bacterium]|nr:inorganic phosphate transporter [Candidatus Cloacimonadota bacterium]MCF7814545.1 inorganic phosphate transporter [Candidatus Cloacimonadota bacterium]MCF7868831.1 inorganic phosphate transporter [Candidatus Cloacimonadota bacterium]MCF7884229.1 inorganic phosphate transporter [Candidatus Cloacimonadota bacterium]
MIKILFYLSSGLFLGWSLGANDAANIFGTAVGTKMLRFRTAAIVCSIFVILGAVISGSGASHTLGKLGAIDTMAGAFIVALAAAVTVFWMTKTGIPVSTSQSIVGAIIGWNFFSETATDLSALSKILGTWIFSPVLAALFAFIIFHIFRMIMENSKIHLIRLDSMTRTGLIIAGIFGSYSLGANNIANVMGVFVKSSPFTDISISGVLHFGGIQQLFLLGGIAIAAGVFTYSKKVMFTVGSGIFKLSPISALVVVLASSIVLFLFASQDLKNLMISMGLPSLPLVPVSSSQAVVGAVMGISLAKGGKNLNFRILGRISLGWITTPVASAIIAYIALFFMQNVFMQRVFLP